MAMLEIFQEILKKQKAENILITKLENIFYLTNFSGSFGWIFAKKSGEIFLITDGRYEEIAKKICQKNNFIFRLFDKDLKTKFAEKQTGKILIEKSNTIAEADKIKKMFIKCGFIFAQNLIEKVRETKNKIEIKKIKRSVNHTDKILDIFFREILQENITEKEAKFKLENLIYDNGNFQTSFEPIVAFGENSSVPHHHSGDKKLQKNENILVDCGSKFKNYCSDITRNAWFGNKIDNDFFNKYEFLKNLQKETLTNFISGQKISDTCQKIRENLGQLNNNFTHSLGHGVGIEIHEHPSISIKNKDVFQKNQIVTCEPGIYFAKKFGIRIEDMILIDDKFSVKNILTKFPTSLKIIK